MDITLELTLEDISITYKNLFVWFKTEYFTFLSQENFEAELERNTPLQK